MGNLADGTVYLSLDIDLFGEQIVTPRWSGHCEFGDGSPIEIGPDFVDASDAVTWWRRRGATSIYIRLDATEYLWAGDGSPPDTGRTLSVFDPADPRGRAKGAATTAHAERRTSSEHERAERVSAALAEGRRLTERREAVHLSVDELADRVGRSTEWLLDVESGVTALGVDFAQWIDLVWATREAWPHESHPKAPRRVSWVARRGDLLREAEIVVNEQLGLYD